MQQKKLIVILSVNGDSMTDRVMNVLQLKHPDITIHRVNQLSDLDQVDLQEDFVVWNRKNAHFFKTSEPKREKTAEQNRIRQFQEEENAVLAEYLIRSIERPVIGNQHKLGDHKLIQLEQAYACNLNVPDYLITSNKEKLKLFLDQHQGVICKPLKNPLILEREGKSYITYTSHLDPVYVDKLPNSFPSLYVQEEVKKVFEIRTFYFYGKCWSMAIFSQNSDQTVVDFRKYNSVKPNRTVPYNLPLSVEKQVTEFMNSMKLNTGSLDFIMSTTGELVFLEVNPEGQFGMVSVPCNYNIEKNIADKIVSQYEN